MTVSGEVHDGICVPVCVILQPRAVNVDLQTDATLQVDISDALSERDKVKFTVHTKVRLFAASEGWIWSNSCNNYCNRYRCKHSVRILQLHHWTLKHLIFSSGRST